MIRIRPWILAAALALWIATTSGCASTGLVNRWGLPGFNTPMKKMLVVAIKRTEVNRRIMEDGFVSELGRYGVTATASYAVFPDAVPDTDAVREYVRANALNGVLVAARLPTVSHTQVTPGYTSTEARNVYSTWSGRYRTYFTEVQHEATSETQSIVPHRVDVWYADGRGGQLVWTAEGRRVDPSSASQVSKELCAVTVAQLAKSGVIPAKQ
jgi:hypothetical protein